MVWLRETSAYTRFWIIEGEMAASRTERCVQYKGTVYQFADDVPSSLLCSICLDLCCDPQQAYCCGKLFCHECITRAKTRNGENCPCCRKRMKVFPDKRTEQEIGSLRIVCPYFERGCREQPELRNYRTHRETCTLRHELVSCSFADVGCRKTMLREEMEGHNRLEVAKHLDLCRATIEKIPRLEEEIRSLKAMIGEGSSLMRAQSNQVQRPEVAVVRCAARVVNIEVDHHDQIISRQGWRWESPVFKIDNIRLIFEVVSITNYKCVISLSLAKDKNVPLLISTVAVTGECELFAKETGLELYKIEPFQIVLGRDSPMKVIGRFSNSDIMKDGITLAPCVVYKLSIWNVQIS